MKVKKTNDGRWMVVANHDGIRLSPFFDDAGQAHAAMEKIIPAIVLTSNEHGFVVVNENNGGVLAGPLRKIEEAYRERKRIIASFLEEPKVEELVNPEPKAEEPVNTPDEKPEPKGKKAA